MYVVDEDKFEAMSQEALDRLWEWYESTYCPRRDLPGNPSREDDSPPESEGRDVDNPVQS